VCFVVCVLCFYNVYAALVGVIMMMIQRRNGLTLANAKKPVEVQ